MQAWEEKAIEREEGRKEGKFESAMKMLSLDFTEEQIQEVTGLTKEEIRKLREE